MFHGVAGENVPDGNILAETICSRYQRVLFKQ